MEQIVSKNQTQTEQIGQKLAQSYLECGGLIQLRGELGSGKTAFVRGFVKGLGIKNTVSSPTFVFLKIYGKVHHLDLYRLNNSKEFEMLGVEELIESDPRRIFLIEWPEKAGIEFKNSLIVNFVKTQKTNERIITIG